MKRLAACLPLLFCVPHAVCAQDTNVLREFIVIDSNMKQLESAYVLHYDSLQRAQPTNALTMVDILSTRSSLNFKNYGPGLLATPTFRGGDAHHTQVLWNGMRLNSPMLGSVDFSTLPAAQFDALSIYSGISSNLYTSGGMGGAVALHQSAGLVHTTARFTQGIGSFGERITGTQINLPFNLGNKRFALNMSSDVQAIGNNYPFIDISSEPYEDLIMHEASFDRSNFSATLAGAPARFLDVQVIWWRSETNRNIPAPINSVSRVASQHDLSHRLLLTLRFQAAEQLSIVVRSMYEESLNAYADPQISIENENVFSQMQNQVEVHYTPVRKLSVSGRISYNGIAANSGNYPDAIGLTYANALIYARYEPLPDRIAMEAGYRYENYIGSTGILPFGGLTVKPLAKVPVQWVISASETIRFPTLNELYWQPGGNPALLPEEGTLFESGFKLDTKATEASVMVFYGEYRNRIRWLPSGMLFEPVNVDYAVSRGVDLFLRHVFIIGTHRFAIISNAEYILAQGRLDKGALYTLTYVPAWSANGTLEWSHDRLTVMFGYGYTGKRFISSDETVFMPYYQLCNGGVMYSQPLGESLLIHLSASAQNLLDWQYQNMPWRAMPGRSFHLKIDLRWKM